MVCFGMCSITLNLTAGYDYFEDPQKSPKWLNLLYYTTSRHLFVFGCACILLPILTGHFTWGRAVLSGSNMRIVAKSLVIGCVI